jgi:E3 ubiquitin-protein ligase HUWE1
VAELVLKISNTSKEDLADVLSEIDAWQWPRSDLNAWIKVLNKFDGMLEQAIAEYEVDKLQRKEFSPLTKRIVCEILRFERLLLENSTNRKMYNSYDVSYLHACPVTI